MLFKCRFSQDVWIATGFWELVTIEATDSVIEMFKKIFNKCNKEQCALVGLSCWSLWNRQNKWAWDRINISVFGIKTTTLNLLDDWNRAREEDNSKNTQHKIASRTWVKPPAD